MRRPVFILEAIEALDLGKPTEKETDRAPSLRQWRISNAEEYAKLFTELVRFKERREEERQKDLDYYFNREGDKAFKTELGG